MVEVTGKCLWAHVTQPNTTFEPCWSIDVQVDDDNKELIKESKLKIYDRYVKVVRFRRRVRDFHGKKKELPFLLDDKGRSWNKGLIGNGSLVTVIGGLHEWTYRNHKGVSADLYSVQVLDHIPYTKEKEVD
jgi:hypothetical protein